MTLGTFKKQPIERLDYDIDYSAFLGTDTLTGTPTVEFLPTGELNYDVVAIMTGNQRLKIWLTDGVSGSSYKVTVTVTTTAGRVKQDEFKVKVRDE